MQSRLQSKFFNMPKKFCFCIKTKKNRTFLHQKSAKFWRRRRDLNSRAGFPTYSLSRGAPSPAWVRLHVKCVVVPPEKQRSGGAFHKSYLRIPTHSPVNFGGAGGIRTHAPFRTNGFQDRLVMTTSIPLRILPDKQEILYPIERDLSIPFQFLFPFRLLEASQSEIIPHQQRPFDQHAVSREQRKLLVLAHLRQLIL